MNSKMKAGFTLVEILAVVAIIGVISGLAVGPIKSARLKSRDTQRKADINVLAQGVDLYYSEKKALPGQSSGGTCASFSSVVTEEWVTFKTLVAAFIPASSLFPNDPLNTSTYNYVYTCDGSAQTYSLKAILENKNDWEGIPVSPDNPQSLRQYVITR